MRWLLLLTLALLSSCATGSPSVTDKVLIFSHTTGYRHESIAPGRVALSSIGRAEGLEPVLSEDPAIFSPEGLEGFRAIIFLSTTTDPNSPRSEWLTGSRREALQSFVREGGGIVGIHAAADSHYDWPWYGRLIGAWFRFHPPGTPTGALTVVDRDHPSTKGLPASFRHTDEWYSFKELAPDSRLLVTLDPASIGSNEPGPNPISWSREVDGARVFYTALGHTSETYAEPFFLEHVRGGVRWVLRRD